MFFLKKNSVFLILSFLFCIVKGQASFTTIQGKLLDENTKMAVPFAKVTVYCEDGNSKTVLCDSLGNYSLTIDSALLCMIKASSDLKRKDCPVTERRTYFDSVKRLIERSEAGALKIDLLLPRIVLSDDRAPYLKVSNNHKGLLIEDSLKLNGLIYLLIDNPSLKINIELRSGLLDTKLEALKQKAAHAFNYLNHSGVDEARLHLMDSLSYHTLHCHDLPNYLPDSSKLKYGLTLTKAVLDTLADSDVEIIKSFTDGIFFTVREVN